MFTLIIAIISIALIVATIAATMYHGGDTLTQGRTAADAAAFVTGAQQISGAEVMHLSLTSTDATTVSGGVAGTDLVVDKYLNSAPVVKGGAWLLDPVNKLVTSTVTDSAVCIQINKAAGMATATAETNTVAEADFAALPYGCVSASKNFEFKY
jgi:hypothetical protein